MGKDVASRIRRIISQNQPWVCPLFYYSIQSLSSHCAECCATEGYRSHRPFVRWDERLLLMVMTASRSYSYREGEACAEGELFPAGKTMPKHGVTCRGSKRVGRGVNGEERGREGHGSEGMHGQPQMSWPAPITRQPTFAVKLDCLIRLPSSFLRQATNS